MAILNRCSVLILCGGLLSVPSSADEGLWTFDNPPVKLIQEKYHFTLTKEWLDHVRLSSVRLNDGGSGSFISPHGLLLTNHHVARGQLQKSSTAEHDYIQNGFYAATPDQEIKSPDLEVDVLMSTEDVTARVEAATRNAQNPEQQFAERKKIIAAIERESLDKTGLRSDVIALYQGGEYWLYRYKKYTDIRIVFAPEQQTAFFGGDPDNFTYPRYDLDMALLRVYENGQPIHSANYLKWNPKGAPDGDLVFVSGNPGSTERLDTVSQIEYQRDTAFPNLLNILRHRIEALQKFSATSEEHARQAASQIFNLQNSVKAIDGEEKGLKDPHVMDTKRADEEKFKAAVTQNPQLKSEYGNGWDEIAEAERKAATRAKEVYYHGVDSSLANLAATIVEYVAEIKKPDGERLPGFHDAQLDSLRFQLFSPAPIYKQMETARMTGALLLDLSEAGAGDAFVRTVLDGRTPHDAAVATIEPTKLDDPALRKQLIEGGEAAVAASADPEIVLARKLDPIRREMIKWQEDNVQSVEQRAGEKLGKARFAVYGRSTYPDATFTLRLSYGTIKGYPMNGTIAPPKTTLYGLYDRAAGFNYQAPFNLAARWREAAHTLDLATPINFVTDNDIIGGNSGSPVIDKNGEIVGLIFDGNIESLVGDFIFDGETNRAVAVHTAAMTEALRKLYGAQKLIDEMLGN
ncbi:MAG TPA: S46 family peptidase [Bryobacteraceae bacterium]|nr:S46 family peptidase [Bryobacteraceae bacterium]